MPQQPQNNTWTHSTSNPEKKKLHETPQKPRTHKKYWSGHDNCLSTNFRSLGKVNPEKIHVHKTLVPKPIPNFRYHTNVNS